MGKTQEDQLTFLSAAPPVSHSVSQDYEKGWLTRVATWPSSILQLLTDTAPAGSFGKMCPVPSVLGPGDSGAGWWQTNDFDTFVAGLTQIGYHCSWRILDAQYVRVDGMERAVPQRRRRVFVVGHFRDWRASAAVLFERQGVLGHPHPRRRAGQRVAADVGNVAEPSRDGSGGNVDRDGDRGDLCVIQHGRDISKKQNGLGVSESEAAYTVDTMGAQAVAFKPSHFTRGKDGAPSTITPPLSADADKGDQDTLIAQSVGFAQNTRDEVRLVGGDGGISGALSAEPGMKQTTYVAQAYDLRGRDTGGQLEGPHDTASVRAASGGSSKSYVNQDYVLRRLTPVECQRLQGFPDQFTKISWRGKAAELCPDTPQYKALGNSMATNVIRWLGQRIEAVDQIMEGQ